MTDTLRRAAAIPLLLVAAACVTKRGEARATPMPAGLDRAASERWIAQRRHECRGAFMTFFDEGQNAATVGPDSMHVYRYVRSVSGVQCIPRR
jgi:hypothetical protein